MPLYCKTSVGWKLGLLMWEKRESGWTMVNPLYVKKSATEWEALPFGTMLAPQVVSPASGAAFKAGSAVAVSVSAISSSGFADPGAGTQIQIATDAGFTNIAAAYDGAYATSWTSTALSSVGTYYIRARHKGATLGWSPWSAAVAFSVAAAMGTATFTSSTTWTAPYDGTYTIFVCGGGGGGGGGSSSGSVGGYGGGAGGDTSVYTISGSSVSIAASGGAGGGGGGAGSGAYGTAGASSSWYSGGSPGGRYGDELRGKPGGGGTGSSPHGMGGAGGGNSGISGGSGGVGGNGGTNSASIWIAQGTVLQIVIGGGGTGGALGSSGKPGSAGSAGVAHITG